MARKRGNNEGSLYKRNSGSWRAQVIVEGRRLGQSFKTKREAQEWLRQMLDEIDYGLTFNAAQIKLDEFMEEWLVSVEPTLRFNTHKQYCQITRQHILPFLGELKLREIKPGQIQRLYNQMVKKGYGLRTVQLIHTVLHRSLVHAVKLGIMPRNPADATTPPKPKPKEMKFYDETQAQKMLITAKAKNDRFYALYHLAVSTGMRQGELLGLKWSDLDRDFGMLQIQRQLTKKSGGGFDLSPPKTRAGVRRIDLGESSLKVLQDHLQMQYQEINQAGEKWQDSDLIFPSTIGTPNDRDNLRKRFKAVLKEAGLPEIRFHDLRHTAAALMLNNGIPVIVVSRRLGHARPSITLDIYGHLIPQKQKEVASLMDELLTPIQIEIEE